VPLVLSARPDLQDAIAAEASEEADALCFPDYCPQGRIDYVPGYVRRAVTWFIVNAKGWIQLSDWFHRKAHDALDKGFMGSELWIAWGFIDPIDGGL
jgi:hypothetical protein